MTEADYERIRFILQCLIGEASNSKPDLTDTSKWEVQHYIPMLLKTLEEVKAWEERKPQ